MSVDPAHSVADAFDLKECERRPAGAVEITTSSPAVIVIAGPIDWRAEDEAWVTVRISAPATNLRFVDTAWFGSAMAGCLLGRSCSMPPYELRRGPHGPRRGRDDTRVRKPTSEIAA
jgi:hypothetical protein